jgi:hypothetical protein
MKKWKTGKPRAKNFNTQLYVMPVIDEDGKQEEILFYATNSAILTQVVEEHNKLVDIFKREMKKAVKNGY